MKKSFFILLFFVFIIIGAQNFDNYQILLLDFDGGTTFPNPDNTEIFIGYEENLIQALGTCGFSTENGNLAISTIMPSLAEITTYAAVFTTFGSMSASFSLLDSTDIEIFSSYLNGGGCLFFEGNNISEFLFNNFPSFQNTYFNTCLGDGGADDIQSLFYEIITDTASNFTHPYTFEYSANTGADLGNDILIAFDASITEPIFFNVLVFDDQSGKLYKTTASAYDLPNEKNKASLYKTYIQTIDLGALSCPYIDGSQLTQAQNNQLIRAAFTRDILTFFSLGNTLLINHSNDEYNTSIKDALDNLGYSYDYIYIVPGSAMPDYSTLMEYASVICYTGTVSDNIFSTTDIFNLSTYMDFGGNVFMFGENIAQSMGIPGYDPINETYFLSNYFGIDYISAYPVINDGLHLAHPSGYYFGKANNITVNTFLSPDVIFNIFDAQNENKAAYGFSNTAKANDSILSGVSRKDTTHNAVFLSYSLETANSSQDIEDVISTTFVEVFGYDTSFTPKENTVMLNSINILYTQNNSNVTFNIKFNNPQNGVLKLKRNDNFVYTINTNENNCFYKLYSKENYGNFTIVYEDNSGSPLYTKSFNILPISQNNNKIYIYANSLFIENDNDSEIAIYDVTGKNILNRNVQMGKNEIKEFSLLSKGVYFIKLNGILYKVVRF